MLRKARKVWDFLSIRLSGISKIKFQLSGNNFNVKRKANFLDIFNAKRH